MAENSKIEWTTHTFNPWRGCTKVSAECEHCYADSQAKRNPGTLGVWGPNGSRVVAVESTWRVPLKWDRAAKSTGERHRVFCASMADVFEEWSGPMTTAKGNPFWWCHGSLSNSPIPEGGLPDDCRFAVMDDFRERLFYLVRETPNLDWLLLTKRPERMAEVVRLATDSIGGVCPGGHFPTDFPNVWLGTSVGVRKTIPRIDHLRTIPAAVRFLSIEPLLEDLGTLDLTGIHWVIVGGESGHGARPMHLEWARSVRDQCVAAGVPLFFKQWGQFVPDDLDCLPDGFAFMRDRYNLRPKNGLYSVGKKAAGRLLDGRTWDEFPETSKEAAKP